MLFINVTFAVLSDNHGRFVQFMKSPGINSYYGSMRHGVISLARLDIPPLFVFQSMVHVGNYSFWLWRSSGHWHCYANNINLCKVVYVL